MQINVSQLLKEKTGATRGYEADENLYLDDVTECYVQGLVELVRTKRGILVRGTFAGRSSLTCSRCLASLEYLLSFNVEEEFLPSVEVGTGAALSQDDDPNTFVIDDHHILDLSEAMRQYGVLAIPMKPLCQPDCAGLCPQCGINLNQSVCRCTPPSRVLPLDELEKDNLSGKSR
ncbi:DUF177 domain-containing protein [Chloroflexota bacterium]